MNNKGFSLVELLAVIVILAIIGGIAAISYTSLIDKTETKSYQNYEQSMKSSATMYIIDNGYKNRITLSELIDSNKIDEFNNPKSEDKCLDSYILVNRDSDDSSSLSYKICLICSKDDYKTHSDC